MVRKKRIAIIIIIIFGRKVFCEDSFVALVPSHSLMKVVYVRDIFEFCVRYYVLNTNICHLFRHL